MNWSDKKEKLRKLGYEVADREHIRPFTGDQALKVTHNWETNSMTAVLEESFVDRLIAGEDFRKIAADHEAYLNSLKK